MTAEALHHRRAARGAQHSRRVRGGRRVRIALALGPLVAVLGALVPHGQAGSTADHARGAAPSSSSGAPRAPVTGADAHAGTLPPANPARNIAPDPPFLGTCSGSAYDDSSGCVSTVLLAIANAREQEGLPGMALPTTWTQLSPTQQVFVVTNLERTVRGLTPLSGMASALDQAAQSGAAQNADPSPPRGFPWTAWGSNWAGNVGNPLEADYYWMYDDGLGSANIDCTPGDTTGCWGHRDNILMSLRCQPCLMGVGYDGTAFGGGPSWSELLVDTSGSPQLDFSWGQVASFLPGSPTSAPSGSTLASPAVGLASTPDGQGYWMVSADGGVFAFGDAGFFGSMGARHLVAPIVGMASTPDGEGYWLSAADGGVFAFGDAGFYGSVGGRRLARPVVGMASTRDGGGYWEVASDGGIFAFGDAGFHGSMGGTSLFRPVVSMASTPDGGGYWLTASDGGIFAFGDAGFRGSTGGHVLNAPVVAMTAPSDTGYWLAAADGGIFSFGVPFHGSMG